MKKRVIALILSLCVVISAFPAASFAETKYVDSGNIRYAVVEEDDLPDDVAWPKGVTHAVEVAPSGGGTSSTYTGAITVPDTITVDDTTYTVVGIGADAFREAHGLTSLALPEGILYIGKNAFLAAGINGKMTSLKIPASVEYIGEYLFTNSGSNGSSYTSITNFTFAEGSRLKKIATGAFAGAQFAALSLPEGLLSIGRSAFEGSKITELTIPASVEELNARAFLRFSGKVAIAEGNPIYKIQDGILYSQTELMAVLEEQKEVTVPKGIVSIYGDATNQYSPFKGNTTLIRISFEDPDAELVEYAFSECSELQSVTLPRNLKAIPQYSFFECSSLKEIDLSGIETIGACAFENCSALNRVDLNTVTSIESRAFSGCTALKSVALSGKVTEVPDRAFFKCTSLSTVVINEGTTSIGETVFTNCPSITTMVLPASLKRVGDNSFANAFYSARGSLVFLGETPPAIGDVFNKKTKPENLIVYYPAEAETEYKSTVPTLVSADDQNGYSLSLSDSSMFLSTAETASNTLSLPVKVPEGMTLTVDSSDEKIATAAAGDEAITVTGKAEGTATITAQLEIDEIVVVKSSCTVTVTAEGAVIPTVKNPVTNTNKITDEGDKQTASDVADSVAATDAIVEAAQSAATDLDRDTTEKNSLINQGQTKLNTEETVSLYTQTYLQIEAEALTKDNNQKITSITLNITPMIQVIASTATNSAEVEIKTEENNEGNAVVVQEPKPLTIRTEAEITVQLPEKSFGKETVYIKHEASNGKVYFYRADAGSDGSLTFTSHHGFSPFTFSLNNEAVAQVGEIGYGSFEDAVNAAGNNQTVTVLNGTDSLSATMTGSSRTIYIENGTGTEITVTINGKELTIAKDGTEEFSYRARGSSSGSGSNPSPLPTVGEPTTPSEPSTPSTPSGFVSDTTNDLTVDGVYQFRITSLDGTVPFLTVSNANFRVEFVSQEGSDYFFKIYAQGAAGSTTEISVNGTALLTATVGGSAQVDGVISDTTAPFTVAEGGTYQFRLTASERPSFTAGSASFTVEYAGQIGSDYFYKVHAVGEPGDGCGFYINGASTPVAVAHIA